MSPRAVPIAAILLSAALLTPAGLPAQRVSGRVVDEAAAPLPDVAIQLQGRPGAQPLSTVTDSAGGFLLLLPGPGTYQLTASRLGYRMVGPSSVQVGAGEEVGLLVRMAVDAVALEPVEVVLRRRVGTMTDQIYERIAQLRARGVGRALTRADIERTAPQSVGRAISNMSGRIRAVESPQLTVNTVWVRGAPTCAPAMFIDGFRVNHRPMNVNMLIDPRQVEAVELYIGSAQAPVGFTDPQGCGSVLIWSRREAPGQARPNSWKRYALAGAVVVGLLLLVN
ncbi:MAG TPA: carboxypeptidase regulatory-like domain-containing protein [Longimicrobiales bacterium]|nr:carboxypeptidase regulatory-like domain-containing protein [Longimicrobiales bacterium]